MTVSANSIKKGDTILLFSARRREPIKAKVKECLWGGNEVTFLTTRGSHTFKITDRVEIG